MSSTEWTLIRCKICQTYYWSRVELECFDCNEQACCECLLTRCLACPCEHTDVPTPPSCTVNCRLIRCKHVASSETVVSDMYSAPVVPSLGCDCVNHSCRVINLCPNCVDLYPKPLRVCGACHHPLGFDEAQSLRGNQVVCATCTVQEPVESAVNCLPSVLARLVASYCAEKTHEEPPAKRRKA